MYALNIFFKSSDTNVTYRIHSGTKLLAGLSVIDGHGPQNITVAPEMVEQLGPGCHHLSLHASDMLADSEASAHLKVHQLLSWTASPRIKNQITRCTAVQKIV